jgi:hypothetical protein
MPQLDAEMLELTRKIAASRLPRVRALALLLLTGTTARSPWWRCSRERAGHGAVCAVAHCELARGHVPARLEPGRHGKGCA